MGALFGGGGTRAAAVDPTIPTPADIPPGRADLEVREASRRARRKAANAFGRSKTILGGGAGPNPPFRQTALGG